jgi:hypothetical protein
MGSWFSWLPVDEKDLRVNMFQRIGEVRQVVLVAQ